MSIPSKRHLALLKRFPLRPIRTEDQLDRAVEVLDSLIDLGKWSEDEEDYLEVLGDLIERYETEHIVIEPMPDSSMLQFLLAAKGVTQTQAAKECGIAESTISEVLAGTRRLNRSHIAKLARYFHVEPGVFAFTDAA